MPRRLRVALAALLALSPLALVACVATPPTPVRDATGHFRCPNPADRELFIDVMTLRPNDGDGVGAGHAGAQDQAYTVDITVQALSPVPGFKGVAALGFPGINNITPTNPGVFDRITPWSATACWPASNPVSLLIRATMVDVPGQAYDLLSCFMEDGHATLAADFVDQQSVRMDPADMLPGAPLVAVQCVDYYTPADWTGEPLHTFNPLPPR